MGPGIFKVTPSPRRHPYTIGKAADSASRSQPVLHDGDGLLHHAAGFAPIILAAGDREQYQEFLVENWDKGFAIGPDG